jgi:hypothetical protein
MTTQKQTTKQMTLLEAEKYLRKIDEWHGVVKMERDTIIKWAMFLKSKEEAKKNNTNEDK